MMNDANGCKIGLSDGVDLEFVYSDTDGTQNEIAELYSYTEFPEFQLNVKSFEEQMEIYKLPPSWQKLEHEQRKSIVMKLMDQLDVSKRQFRMQAARCILYLAQGCWAEVQSDEEQLKSAKDNILLLYDHGVFSAFVELLNLEIENTISDNGMLKVAVSLADSMDLRVILSVLYLITETMRAEKESGNEDYTETYDNFVNEINNPYGDELLSVKLLGMITRFCSGTAPHFPMKKVLLLLWKVSLVSLGGMEVLKKLKNDHRTRYNLPETKEDTLEITKCMRASSPPTTAADILDNQNQKRNAFRRIRTNEVLQENLMKQSSFDDQEQLSMEMESQSNDAEEDLSDYYRPFDDPALNSSAPGPAGQRYDQQSYNVYPIRNITRLPWAPKVRQKDIDQFLDISRNKFIGYTLIDDHESLAGLPQPIHEGIKTLKRYMYTSLADVQIKKEEEITRNPISTTEEIQMTPAEILYQAILPNLPQYMIALLKILLAASPTSKSKAESINIMADVLPKEMPMTVTQSTKLGIDVNRHKEIIVKAVSAILLIYLKHFKINHIYQFEFMSQHLVFANCIPLVLKFFNQNIMEYIGSKNAIPIMDFPSCVIGEQPELTSDSLVIGDSAPYSWRNVFSCINLLRILNKLIKWKHSRVMMLVVFKSAPILKKTLKVRHAMMQLYVLKLLKMQTKYLGRQWRKANMKTISAIYAKVRHRLNDDWAFGNDLESRPWDFQAEECTLRTCVDRFNNRRYPEAMQKCQTSITGTNNGTANNAQGNNGSSIGRQNGGNGGNTNCSGNNVGNINSGNGDTNDSDIHDNYDNDISLNTNGNGNNNNGSSVIGNNSYGYNYYGTNIANNGFGNEYSLGYGEWDKKVELTEDFKANYELWLQDVFSQQIDWDALLDNNIDIRYCEKKNKTWEKERRDRLNKSFDDLAKLLPNYDPSVSWTKAEIIQKSIAHIQHLKERTEKYLATKDPEILKNHKEFKEALKFYQIRNGQLSDLLKKAKITLPPFDLPKFFTNNPSIYEEIKIFENDIKGTNNDISKLNDRICTRINTEKKGKGKKENINLNLEVGSENKVTEKAEATKEKTFPQTQINKNDDKVNIHKENPEKDFENSTIVPGSISKSPPLIVESESTSPLKSSSNTTNSNTITPSANDENILKTQSSTASTVESSSSIILNTNLTSSCNATKTTTSTVSVTGKIISNLPSPTLQINETEIKQISTISTPSADLQNLPLIIETPLNVLQQSNSLVLPATSLSVPFITLPPGSVPTIIKFENILSSSAKKIKLEDLKTETEPQTGIKTIKILPQPTVKLYYPNVDGKVPIPALKKKIIIKNKKIRKKRKNEETVNVLKNDKKIKYDNNDHIKDNLHKKDLEINELTHKLTDPVNQLFNKSDTDKLLDKKAISSVENICNNENLKTIENDSIEEKISPNNNEKDSLQIKLPNVNTHIRTVSPTAAFLKSFPKVASQLKVNEDKTTLPGSTTCLEFLNKEEEIAKIEGVVSECKNNIKITQNQSYPNLKDQNEIKVPIEEVANINHNKNVTLENSSKSTEIDNKIDNSAKIVITKINENLTPIQDVKNEKNLKQIAKQDDFPTKLYPNINEPRFNIEITNSTVPLQNSSELSKDVITFTTKSSTIFSPYFDNPTQNTVNKKNSISLSSLNLSTQVPICTPLPLESLQSKGKNETKPIKTSFNFSIPSITSNLTPSSKSLNELSVVDKNKNETISSGKETESNINNAKEEKQSKNCNKEFKINQENNMISESQEISKTCSSSQLFSYPPLSLPNMWNTVSQSNSVSVTKTSHSSYTAPFYLNSLPIFNSDFTKNSNPSCSESIKETLSNNVTPPSIVTTTSTASKHNLTKCFASSNNLLPSNSTSTKQILNNSNLKNSSSNFNPSLNCSNEKQLVSSNISISENNQFSHSANSYPVFTFSLTSNTQPCTDVPHFSSTQITKSTSMFSNVISSSTTTPTYTNSIKPNYDYNNALVGNSKTSNFDLTRFPALSNTKLQAESNVVLNKTNERNLLPESKLVPTSVFNSPTEPYFNNCTSTLPFSTKNNSLINASEYYTNKISSVPLIPMDSTISTKETSKEKGGTQPITSSISANSDKKVSPEIKIKSPIKNCTSSLATNSSFTDKSYWASPSTTFTNSKLSNCLENQKTKSVLTPSSNASAEVSIKVSQNTTSLAKINVTSELNSIKNSNCTSYNTTASLPLNSFNSYKIGYMGDSVENSSLVSNNFPRLACAGAPPWSSNLLQNNASNNYINYDMSTSYSGFNYNSNYLAQNTEHQSQLFSSQNTSNTLNTNNYLNVDLKNDFKEKSIYSASNLFKTKVKDPQNESLDKNIPSESQHNRKELLKSNKVFNTENIVKSNFNNTNPGISSSGKSEKIQDQINKNTLTKQIVSSSCSSEQTNFSKAIYNQSSNNLNILSENNLKSVQNTAAIANILNPSQNNVSTIPSSIAENVTKTVAKTTQKISVTNNSIHTDTKHIVLPKTNIPMSNQNALPDNVNNIDKNIIKPLNKSSDVQYGSLEYLSKVNQNRTLNQSNMNKDSTYNLNSSVKTTEVTTVVGQINNFNLPAITTFASTNNYKPCSSQKIKTSISSNNNSHYHSRFYDIASNNALSSSTEKNLITNSVRSSSCSNPKQHVSSISSNSNNMDSNNFSSTNNCAFYSNNKNYYYPLQGENSVPYNNYSMTTGIGHSNSYNSDSRSTSLISYPNIKSDLPWITPSIPPTTLSTTDYNTFTFSLTPTTNTYVTTASQYSSTSFSFSLTTPKSSTSTSSASTSDKLKCFSSKNSFSNQDLYSHEFDSNFNSTKYQTTEPTNFQFSLQKPSNNKVDNNFLINNVEKTNYNFSIDSQLNSKTDINQTNMTNINNNEFKIPNSVAKLKNKTSSIPKSDKRTTDNQKEYYDCDQNKHTIPTIKTSQKNTVNWMTSGSDSIPSSTTSHYNSSIFGDFSTNQQNNLTHNENNNQNIEKKSSYYPPIDENIVTWSPNKLFDQSMNNYSHQPFYGNTNDYQVTNNFAPQSNYQSNNSNSSCKQIKTDKNTPKEQTNSNFFSIKQFVDQTSSSIADQNAQKYYGNYQNLQAQGEQNLDINQRISQNQTHHQQNQSISNKIQGTNNQKKISPIKLKDHNRKDINKTNSQNINNFIESTTTNLNHNQSQQQQPQQQSQLQTQQQPHQEQQETTQKSGQSLLCNYSAESLISKKDKYSKNLSNYNNSFDPTNLYSSNCNPIGQHTDLVEQQQNYSSNYFPSYSSTNNNNNHNFISEVDYLGANIFSSTETNTDTFNKLNSTSFLKDTKKSNSISNYSSTNISHFPSHPHNHSSTYESNYLPVPPLVSSAIGNENCDSTYPFNNNSIINNHNQTGITPTNNYSNYGNWNSTSKQYMVGSQNNNNNGNTIGSQYPQQISSNSNMNQSEQVQINSQSSSVGTNLPNFNLSSICPEINDKVCSNDNVW